MALPLIYNWRNLFVRKSSTLLTFGVVTLIVFVLTWALAFGQGLRDSLKAGGALDKLVIIKPGATGESTSFLTLEEFTQLSQLPGVARSPSGRPLCSGEICTQATLPLRSDPTRQVTLVAVRGVDEEVAFDVHRTVKMLEGRRFHQGADELIVGRGIVDRVNGASLGEELSLGYRGGRRFKVVGVFEAAGGPLESEIWCSISPVRDVFNRSSMVSSASVRIESPAQADELIRVIGQPPYKLQAKTEQTYYQEIAERSAILVNMTLILVFFMAFGACFAVANTIYAAVDGRSREIAMLRTIGYGRASIVWSFMLESALICCGACVVGAFLATLFHGHKEEFLSDATWTTFAYQVKVTPWILLFSFAAAMAVAFIGAIVPAVRASRMNILVALRQA